MRLVDKFSIILAFFVFLDLLVTTPLALGLGATEANPFFREAYHQYGAIFFLFAAPSVMILIFIINRGYESVVNSFIKKDNKHKRLYVFCLWLLFITSLITYIFTVVNNLNVIFKFLT